MTKRHNAAAVAAPAMAKGLKPPPPIWPDPRNLTEHSQVCQRASHHRHYKAKAKNLTFKAKEFSFIVKAKVNDFYAVFKDTSRPRPKLRTNILADLHCTTADV